MTKNKGSILSHTAQKILAGRRVAIPKEMFQKVNLQDGGIVILEQDEDGIISIIPAEVTRRVPA